MLTTTHRGAIQLIIERVGRQLAQTALPIVLVAGAIPGRHDVRTAVIAIAISALVTILKAVAGIRASAMDSILKQLVDRAAPAFAGTLLGFIPADAANWGAVDWGHVFWAAFAAAVSAVVAYYATPPSNVVSVATLDPVAPSPAVGGQIPGEAELEEREVVDDDGY